MTALSPAIDVGIIEDGLVAASLAAYLVQAGIDCGSATEKASRQTTSAARVDIDFAERVQEGGE
jgi:hypothetical protein